MCSSAMNWNILGPCAIESLLPTEYHVALPLDQNMTILTDFAQALGQTCIRFVRARYVRDVVLSIEGRSDIGLCQVKQVIFPTDASD